MTVTELIAKLQKIEAEGLGDAIVNVYHYEDGAVKAERIDVMPNSRIVVIAE